MPSTRPRARRLPHLHVLACALIVAAALPASAAAADSQFFLRSVSCVSSTRCAAIGYAEGGPIQAVTFDPSSTAVLDPSPIAGQGSRLDHLSCATSTRCVASGTTSRITGQGSALAVVFDPTSPSSATQIALGGDKTDAFDVSCPTETQCTAPVANVANGPARNADSEVTFNPGTHALSAPLAIPGSALSCPSTSQCTATAANETTFDPVSGATTSSLPGNYAQVVDCPSVTQCTTAWVGETSSAQQEAKEMTFDPTTGTPNSAGTVGLGTPNVYLLACALSQCTIVVGDSHTTLLSFDPATGSRRAPVPVGGAGIADMTCPSASLCVMVTGGGQALAYDPGSGTHRIIGTVSGGGGGAAAAALGPALVPSGTAAKIGAILKAGAFPATVSPPGPGKAAVAWYYAPKGTHVASVKKPVVIASGTTTVKKAGSVKLKIRLTSAGRTMLKNAKSIALTSKGTFTPKGGKAVSTQKKFKLKR